MLKSFRAEGLKAIRLAQCDSVPPVMVIAGPNGVGKSTLLSAIHRRQIGVNFEDDTTVLYQPPHRAIRRQRVQRRYLMGALKSFVATLTGNDVQGFEGLPISYPARLPDNVDEAGSTLKFTLGQFENRRQAMLARRVDALAEAGQPLETAGLPKVYAPLAELTQRLLPHLVFTRIDFTNEDDIRCVFRRTDGVTEDLLDLDDLSSGEKSIFLLFLPLVEDEIQARLRALGGDGEGPALAQPHRLFLIDEPEQHLHPDLQSRILGYLRDQAAAYGTQFIVATHSPTLVDQATDIELYVLNFSTGAGVNQLRRVATNEDRLAAIRSIAGTTYPVTTGRTIVCLEGVRQGQAATDIGLLGVLLPDATRYTFVPLGGRGNVLRAVPEFRARLREEGYGIAVYGVVDLDQGDPGVEGVVAWDVAMIENLLLDPDAIAATASALLHREVDVETSRTALTDTAAGLRGDEISLRVGEAIGFMPIRIRGASAEQVSRLLKEARSRLDLDDATVTRMVDEATNRVDQSLRDGTFARTFRGKPMLAGIHQRLGLDGASVRLDTFAYALAQECARRGSVRSQLERVFGNFR